MGVGWGLDPRENMSEGSEYALTPPPQKKSAFFHSKLLLDNSAIFTSSRMSKMEGKTNFFGVPGTVLWLYLTDPDHPIYFTTDLRHHCT